MNRNYQKELEKIIEKNKAENKFQVSFYIAAVHLAAAMY